MGTVHENHAAGPSQALRTEPAAQPAGSSNGRRVLTATGLGNVLEWYDFSLYGFLAVPIGAAFFHSGNQGTDLLATFAALGVAFVSRPFGGIIFGHFGDKRGRRGTLAAIILLMTIATAAVGMLPTAAAIGIWAPILLVVCRLAQGFSAGAEFGGASTFILEHAPRKRRGLYLSSITSSIGVGIALAAGVSMLLNSVLGPQAMLDWGWRVPFLLSLPLGLSGLYIRLKLDETHAFKQIQKTNQVSRKPIIEAIRTQPKALNVIFWICAANGVNYYILLAYIPNYLQTKAGLSAGSALGTAALAELVMAVAAPLIGYLMYKINPSKLLLASVVGFFVLNVPVFMLITQGTWTAALVGQSLLALCVGLLTVGASLVLFEILPPQVRFTGYGIANGVSYVLFAGTAAFVAQFLTTTFNNPYAAPIYAMAVTLIAIIVGIVWLPGLYREAQKREATESNDETALVQEA